MRSSTDIMNEIFQLKEEYHYHLCQTSQFIIVPHVHSVFNGSETVSFLGAKIWELVIKYHNYRLSQCLRRKSKD